MRIAVFGGTFNPPHLGHTKLAETVLKKNLAGKILFIPAYRPPHKIDWDIAAYEDRLAMLKIAVNESSRVLISEIEGQRPDVPSYTAETMSLLAKSSPDDTFVLLIGEDSLLQLHSWYKAEELVGKWEIITYPRPPASVTREYLLKHWSESQTEKLFNSKVEMPVHDVSSTEIRHALKHNLDTSLLIASEVEKYIKEKSLYQ